MNNKRAIFRDRLEKYIDQNIDDDKIGVNTLYAMVNLYIAIQYSDTISVLCNPRKFWDEEYADNLTELAKFDYGEMEMNRKDYQKHWDKAMFWLALRKKTGYNSHSQVPDVTMEDPLSWLPDPYGDHLTPFRWHYFEKEISEEELKNNKEYDEEGVEWMIQDLQTTRSARNRASALSDIRDETELEYCQVYEWVTNYMGKLYIVTVNAQKTRFLKMEEVKPVTKYEKAMGIADIRSIVNVTWFSPKKWDPCGVALADLVIPGQKANSILVNLRLIDAKFSTFGQTNLVNTDLIKDTSQLSTPSINTKWIGVSGKQWSIADAVYPVPRQSIMQDSYQASNEIKALMQESAGMDSRTLWVQWDKSSTLWEVQQIQTNANVRFGLWIEIDFWWEHDFWKYIWFRSYVEFFSPNDTKFIRIASWFGSQVIEFKRDDFLWSEDIDFTIESKKKIEQMREKMKLSFDAKLPMILQDPNTSEFTKKEALRFSLKLDGMPREYTTVFIEPTLEEVKAKQKVILINNNDPYWAQIDEIDEDHMVYIKVFESARDVPMKYEAIKRRWEAYAFQQQKKKQDMMMQWQIPWQQGTINGMANASASQLQSASISQSKPQASLQTV